MKKHLPENESAAHLRSPLIHIAAKPNDAKAATARFVDCLKGKSSEDQLRSFLDTEAGHHFAAILARSPYLCDLACRFPDTVLACIIGSFSQALEHTLTTLDRTAITTSESDLSRILRQAKQEAALIAGLADLSGCWSCETVSHAITDTADTCLRAAVDHLLFAQHERGKLALPDPQNPSQDSGYTVIAMGKHGARELNYSSDIDLIVFIDPDAKAVTDPEDVVLLFTRVTKGLIKLMQEQTADGYVFRTDLRLRPDPGSMPLAIPMQHAMHYYESRGQNWERAALIKARTVAGDMSLGAEMLGFLRPFVWRRYLDYAAIADIHSIKRQLQSHRGFSDLSAKGHNVKLGRGGIREIEFFVQTQQLVAGGRIEDLRERGTLEMLRRLAEHKWIKPHVRDELCESYRVLRDVEHRLQMVRDEQTHEIPKDKDAFANIAALCNASSPAAFEKEIVAHLTRVEGHYADLFSNEPTLAVSGNLSFTGDEEDPGTVETLDQLGFNRPSDMIAMVKGWHFGRYRAMQTVEARERLTEITPALLEAFADTGAPDEAMIAFDAFLKGLPAGFQLMNMMRANPKLMDLLVLILGAAPRLAAIVTHKPHVFDALLEPGFFNDMPKREELQSRMAKSLDAAAGYEEMLDRARLFVAEQRFLIGVRVLAGACPAQEAGAAFALLAEVAVQEILKRVVDAFAQRHGHIEGASVAVVSMGNLGTRELTAASDLDLIVLYEFDEANDESDGEKPLHAYQYFSRLTQRLTAAMSAPTGEGVVYELDFRLRPSGNAGPLATTLSSFERYQREEAWTWERLALSRSRPVAGDAEFVEKVSHAISDLLAHPRERKEESAEVLKMRKLMDKERPPASVWDVKLAKGGMIDLEFMAQTAVLRGDCPKEALTRGVLVALGEWLNARLVEAYDFYAAIQQLTRIAFNGIFNPDEVSRGFTEILLRCLDMPDLESSQAALKDYQAEVRLAFKNYLKQID
ncbi:bifunctional [glutamine synthetase] adenylyltransferase/[glutamine synthetase]-adenylyl-L-tyrosine phosphorylase [Pseudahrensia aquimaris]|uniref:Bifunctional glutamine synthetase adenylyltransferase/adenylyl-removing enzyme n=1 Tax=Pseudahrensia aquimaris TaxID=744461 RepID=A0ABW3FFW6_9HYPH